MGAIVGVATTVRLLDVIHAIELDHVAGIPSLTSECSNPKLSALADPCFHFGHAALIVGWLIIAYMLPAQIKFPVVFDVIELVIRQLVYDDEFSNFDLLCAICL